MDAKSAVREMLDRLPEGCSLEEVMYHLYVLQETAIGVAEADAGEVITHEQVARDLRRKWLLGAVG